MNRKETIALAVVGMALLAAVMSMPSPTQSLALGHWNLDEDYTTSGFAEDGMDSSGTTDNTNGEEEDSVTAIEDDGRTNSESVVYEEFQRCLSDAEGKDGFISDHEIQDCYESNFGEDSIRDTSTENMDDGDEDENGLKEDVTTDDIEEEDEG